MLRYVYAIEGIRSDQLQGFFEGWRQPLAPEAHLRLLGHSDEIILAVDDEAHRVVGFITAITDRVLSAYIPVLEVLPEYRQQGQSLAQKCNTGGNENSLQNIDRQELKRKVYRYFGGKKPRIHKDKSFYEVSAKNKIAYQAKAQTSYEHTGW